MIDSVKANYEKKSNEIDLNKEMALLNAKQQIASIQEVEKPSLFGTVLGLAATYYKAREHQEQLDMMRDKAMVKDNGANTSTNITITSPIPSYSYSTADWNQQFAITDRSSHFTFDYKNPLAGVQQHYW